MATSRTQPTLPPGPIRLTVDDLRDLPDDGKRYELIDGELHVTPSPAPKHQRVSSKLQFLLVVALQHTDQGEVYNAPMDVVLDDATVVQPDLLFLRTEHLHFIGEKNIQGAPDLVVEILSPSTRRHDVLVKSSLYARFGVPSYWIVDPDLDRIELYRLDGTAYRLATTVQSPAVAEPEEFPGLRLPLLEIFGR